jgi:hypothetical protein
MSLAGDDWEHVVVVPSGLLAPTAKAGLAAAIAGNEVEAEFAYQGGMRAAVRLRTRL